MRKGVEKNIAVQFIVLLVLALGSSSFAVAQSDTQQLAFATNKLYKIAKALPVTWNSKDTLFTVSSVSKTADVRVRRKDGLYVTHIGIDFFNDMQRENIGLALSDFVERTLLETLLQNNEQEANLLVKEYKVKMTTDGRTTQSPQLWVRTLLSSVNSASPISIDKSDKTMILRWTSSSNHIYGFELQISREAVEGTKKVEAEAIAYRELSMIPKSSVKSIAPPSKQSLKHNTKTDLLILPGESFVHPTVNTETYYSMSKGVPRAVFDKRFVVESVKNLMQGVIRNNNYQLNVKMNTYEKQMEEKQIALKDFVDYWKQKPDFDVFCGVGSVGVEQNNANNKYEAVIIFKHKDLLYTNMLRISFDGSIFDNPNMTLNGSFITNIPLHNIDRIF